MGKRPRTPHFITGIGDGNVNLAEGSNKNNNNNAPVDDIFVIGNSKSGGGGGTPSDNAASANTNRRNHPFAVGDRYYVRARNERLARLEQPLLPSDHWRDVFSGDPTLGKPSSTISGPWQVSAFALLGLVVVMSAIFLHMVADNHSDSTNTPYGAYRRRQRHARRMYKTRKKKTDEWSDDEEDFIIHQTSAAAAAAAAARHSDHTSSGGGGMASSSPGEDAPFYTYYYSQGSNPGGAGSTSAAHPAFTSHQEHRHRRTGSKDPNTPPSAGGHSTYYMPVSATYKSPSANLMAMTGVHRRGVSPGSSFNSSNKSAGGTSPGPRLGTTTTSVGINYSSGGSHAPSPSGIMRATAPISGRLRVPTPPDARDLFPTIENTTNLKSTPTNTHRHSITSGGGGGNFHGLEPMLPPPPEESQLLINETVPSRRSSRGPLELGATPILSSNFSSFASMDGSSSDARMHSSNSHARQPHSNHPTSNESFQLGQLIPPDASADSQHHLYHSHHLSHSQRLHHSQSMHGSSHHRSLVLSPGNNEAETPQVGNTKKLLHPDVLGGSMSNLNHVPHLSSDLAHSPPMPYMPTLESAGQHHAHADAHMQLQGLSPPVYFTAAAPPPRSVNLEDMKLFQMETGSSSHWAVKEHSESHGQDDADMETSIYGDDYGGGDGDGDLLLGIDSDSDTRGSDISIPSGDPRKRIIHERSNLTMSTDSYSALQSGINFEELKLEEVIGGGGFGQVWRASWRGTPVAVKVLTGAAQNKHIAKAILEEFKAEINLLKGMRHPNICLYMGACVQPPNRAIVTELAANGSVWDALRLPLSPPYVPADGTAQGAWPLTLYLPNEHGMPPTGGGNMGTPTKITAPIPPKGSWPWPLVRRVAFGAARGMAYLHSGNPPVLHRDLKSANLLLDESYTAKVCDFGLSRLKAQARSMTGNCGTVQWMAPEVLANQKYDEKADVFSYGIILWELLSRECPYEGMTAIQCALAVLNRDKRPEIPKWCPPALHALIKSCIKKDQSQRPTFSQIIDALDAMET